ncbi:hypothetical protein X801_02803 [Opisthorchis viverrini]|uniref:Uncharacterized protein n=1 Tax=Opisthorchis viverrini TaxID=6198 RepID=A0A1S8X4C2_OPIVI|nr:hypothetical protein X801_02803 [Opisthorchis viverrini]
MRELDVSLAAAVQDIPDFRCVSNNAHRGNLGLTVPQGATVSPKTYVSQRMETAWEKTDAGVDTTVLAARAVR